MYEINFHTEFSSTWFASLSIAASSFSFFGQFDSTKLNSIRKVLDGKVRNFSPTKISSFTVIKKLNSTERGALFRHFCVSKVIATAHAHKSGVIFHFCQELSNKKN